MKKMIALLIALVTLLSLAACGGQTTTKPPATLGDDVLTDNTETPANPEEPGAAEEPEEVLEPWDGDYENATFADVRKYGIGSTNWDGSLPLTTTGETLEIGVRAQTKVTDWKDNPLTKWLEEKTGVNLEFHVFAGSASDVTTQISLMLNGGEAMPDIITTDGMASENRADFVDEGYLVNLAGYFITDSYYMKQAIDRACKDNPEKALIMMDNIQLYTANMRSLLVYGQPTFTDTYTDTINTEVVINKDWLNKLGLQKPTTVDELYDVLVAFRDKDPNGNGKKDEVPMIAMRDTMGRGFENFLITPFIQYALQVKAMFEDGKAYVPYNQDEYRQALIFVNKLFKEGLLSNLTFTMGSNEFVRMLNPTGNEPQTVGIATLWITNDFKETSNAIDSYEPLAALKDATGRGGYSFFDPATVRSRWSIPWDCENVLLAFRFLDFMYCPDAYLRQRFGEEGVDWDWIENTEYKDMAEGNGVWGGRAAFVQYTDSERINSRWFLAYQTYQDEINIQQFIHPEDNSFGAKRLKLSAENVRIQREVGEPADEMHVMVRTPEEDEIFQETNTDLVNFYKRAKNEFCSGMRDPNSNAEWEQYLADLESFNMEESWGQFGQNVFDRWVARLEAAGLR